jgi:IclR family acetate operon transcriptional repressor
MLGRVSPPQESQGAVRAVRRAIKLLQILGESQDGIGLSALAREADLHKATTQRYLQTLEEERWVERDRESGKYVLGSAIPAPTQSFARITRIARAPLARLAQALNENIVIGALDQNQIVVLDVVESWQVLRVANRPRDRDWVHSTALGKAILSTMPDEVVERLLRATGMPGLTDRTITDMAKFIDGLATVRERGFAVADRENDPDTRSVAVPILLPHSHFGLSLTAPAMRFPVRDAPAVAEQLMAEAKYIADNVAEEPLALPAVETDPRRGITQLGTSPQGDESTLT